MVDHFATLGLARSAALDEAVVRERFHALSREAHPDAAGGDERVFAEINEAQRVLTSPAARLRHLIELEFGTRPQPTGQMSAELMDLFTGIGVALQAADALILKRKAAASAVAKALLAKDEVVVQRSLMEAGGQLMSRCRQIEDGFSEIDLSERSVMEAAWHELSFLEKWQRQVQERMAGLL